MFTTAISAFAVGSDYSVLRSTNYSYANAVLNISAGEATATGIMQGIPGVTTKITVHLYLQQYKDGKWVDYDDWTKLYLCNTYPKIIRTQRLYLSRQSLLLRIRRKQKRTCDQV